MGITYDYWREELGVFLSKFKDPNTPEEVLGALVKGLCYLAGGMATKFPDHRSEILEDLTSGMKVAKDRMGVIWFLNHAIVISGHSQNHIEVARLIDHLTKENLPS